METTEVSQGGRRKCLLASSVILFLTIAVLSIVLYFQLKVSETPCKDEPCYNDGTCIEVGKSFNCLCPFGYSGSKCENSICSTEPCLYNGSCIVNGTLYVCSCQDGYYGTQCEETQCSNQPCLNNGSCEILEASYVCFCPDGYNGTNCEVTPCSGNPCLYGGTCTVSGSSYLCSCLPGHSGISCEDSSCSSKPCLNNGSCILKGTSYVCSCQDGYNGTQCEMTPCSGNPCLYGGTCTVNGSSYLCSCLPGYSGTSCEVTPCSGNPCLYGGTCTVGESSYWCSCLPGYSGISCEDNHPFCCNCGMGNDCADNTTCASGTYELHLTNIFEVYCDMEIDYGGWIVFQRRLNGEVDFYRDWNSYKYGFGDLDGEFWLGLEQIHEITKEGNYTLRIDLEDFEGETRYALYSNFLIENASSEYTLRVSGYSGTAGDAMALHNDMHFSTKDRGDKIACATSYKGAWWYGHCHHSNLNGLYLNGSHFSHANGINWLQWKGHYYSLKTSKMMVRRKK